MSEMMRVGLQITICVSAMLSLGLCENCRGIRVGHRDQRGDGAGEGDVLRNRAGSESI